MNDFIRDFRFGDDRDFRDHPFSGGFATIEFTDCNRDCLQESFLKVKDRAKAILEIGVCRNGQGSSTYVFLNNKKDETIYIGIDLENKKFLDNPNKNIFTLQTDSSNTEEILKYAESFGVFEFDYIFIDGWHSVDQCIKDWKFVDKLADGGIVGLHDTNNHPGPSIMIANINAEKWTLDKKCDVHNDNGIAFLQKKN